MPPVLPGAPALPAPPASPRPRTFHCPSALWENLERAAREQSRTVDQLIHDALTRYLQPPAIPGLPSPPREPARIPSAPPSLRGPSSTRPTLPLPSRGIPGAPPPLPRITAPLSAPLAPPVLHRAPPPLPPSPTPPRPLPALSNSRLAILHNGMRHEVDVPGFVIGRGKQLAGLSIRDPNISRRHAIIEREQGTFYLVDMGSTNGTHVNGQMIKRHAICEGDVVRIADEELIFTFQR